RALLEDLGKHCIEKRKRHPVNPMKYAGGRGQAEPFMSVCHTLLKAFSLRKSNGLHCLFERISHVQTCQTSGKARRNQSTLMHALLRQKINSDGRSTIDHTQSARRSTKSAQHREPAINAKRRYAIVTHGNPQSLLMN